MELEIDINTNSKSIVKEHGKAIGELETRRKIETVKSKVARRFARKFKIIKKTCGDLLSVRIQEKKRWCEQLAVSKRIRTIIIIIASHGFFTTDLVDGLSLEYEWLQVSSGLQDSKYSGRS